MSRDRKSTRLNSSHPSISYAVFCLKKKKNKKQGRSLEKNKKTKDLRTFIIIHIPQLLSFLRQFMLLPLLFLFFFFFFFFFFNDTATTEIYTLSLHDALPI